MARWMVEGIACSITCTLFLLLPHCEVHFDLFFLLKICLEFGFGLSYLCVELLLLRAVWVELFAFLKQAFDLCVLIINVFSYLF